MIMTEFLLQQALNDEWQRVFFDEKRVGLGVFVVVIYCIALLSTIVTASWVDGTVSILLLPSFVSALVSAWMNIAIFWNRLENQRKKVAIDTVNGFVGSLSMPESRIPLL